MPSMGAGRGHHGRWRGYDVSAVSLSGPGGRRRGLYVSIQQELKGQTGIL